MICRPGTRSSSAKDGFRYLLDEGIHYNNAHHTHANTETIVGHTTLATGANPAAHGMVGNLWFDRTAGKTVYNIEDPDYSILTGGAGVDADTEIDPTQKAASSDGRSPRTILTTTFGDELSVADGRTCEGIRCLHKRSGRRVDGGTHREGLLVFEICSQFVTSTYYYDAYPDWVVEWNAKGLPQSYSGKSWELLNPYRDLSVRRSRRSGLGARFCRVRKDVPSSVCERPRISTSRRF